MKQLLFVYFCLCLSFTSAAQSIDQISTSVKMGNANQLSQLFNTSVEIIVDGVDKVYTKAQAQMVMTDFFKKNQPTNFNIAHKSQRDDSQFLIGNYVSAAGKSFRIMFLLREKEGKTNIYQIRIQ